MFSLMFVTLTFAFLWSRQQMEVDGKEGEEARKKAAEVGPGEKEGEVVLREKEEDERSIHHMKWMQS